MFLLIKKWIPALVIFLSGVTFCYANSLPTWWQNKSWHPVISIGGGVAISSDIGASQNYPIQNGVTDEYYNYSANHSSKTSGLVDIFLGTEWNLRPQWALQTGIGYSQNSNVSSSGTLVQGADVTSQDTYSYTYNILSRQLLAEAKLLYSFKEQYHPYLFAGLGAAFNNAYGYSTNVPSFLTFTRMYQSNNTASFSYAAGVGIDYDLTAQVRIGVGYRFTDLGRVKLGQAVIDTTNVSGSLSQSHFYNNELLAQLTWKI